MNLTPNFTLAEFTRSAKARELKIDNSLPEELLASAVSTAEMLERIRATLGVPIKVSSGYRCIRLNIAVGSKSTSDHVRAEAADWSAPAYGTPFEICRVLAPLVSSLVIGQLIYEKPRATSNPWIHTATRVPRNPANRIITLGPTISVQVGIVDV